MADTKTDKTKGMTKSAIVEELAKNTNLTKKQIGGVFDALAALIKQQLGKKGPGVFAIPGLLKLQVDRKPAKKAYKGINPFTKEEQMFKAKPARNVVKARPLKNLKDMVK